VAAPARHVRAVCRRIPHRLVDPGGLVEGIGYNSPPGLGTLCYGLAFLFIAAVRVQRAGGLGWQAILGGALVLLGASELALPTAADLILPVVLVILGLVLLTRQRA
jgi:hypothetical protein